jgi:hypothetical protein
MVSVEAPWARPAYAQDVDAPMRLEVLVFNGDDGLAQDRRKVVVIDHHAAFQREGADDAALAVVEIGSGGGAVVFEVVNLWQVDRINQREPGQRAGNDRQREQRNQHHLAGQLAPPLKRIAQWREPVVTVRVV